MFAVLDAARRSGRDLVLLSDLGECGGFEFLRAGGARGERSGTIERALDARHTGAEALLERARFRGE